MADDPLNNTEWVILAICGALVVCTALILLCVFCCCGLCGRGGGMCPGFGGQGNIMVVQQAPNPTDAPPPNLTGTNPVPDPTFMSNMPGGGTVKIGSQNEKMKVIRLEKNDPTQAVRQVVKEYYSSQNQQTTGDTKPQPQLPPAQVPTYIVDDTGYSRGREVAPYQIIRGRDPEFDQTRWVPPWQRRK